MILGKLNMILFSYEDDSYEYRLAKYLICHQNSIESIRMVDILKETDVSKSTLSRFFKKLGYKSYTDIQYLLSNEKKHGGVFEERSIDHSIVNKLKGKKRIIVLGDSYSVSPLLVYQQKFFEIGIELIVKLTLESYGQMVKNKEFRQDDLVIIVSLYKSDLDLMAEFFSGYLELKQILKDRKVDYLYVGKVATGNRDLDDCYKIDENNFSDAIYQLCCLFEMINNFYNI